MPGDLVKSGGRLSLLSSFLAAGYDQIILLGDRITHLRLKMLRVNDLSFLLAVLFRF